MTQSASLNPQYSGQYYPAPGFPLELSFKVLALSGRIFVRDADGRLHYFVKQKAFKLKEDVTVFADEQETKPLFRMAADRILDISARYAFSRASGETIGALQRQGMRSIWRAHYDVYRESEQVMSIREENPWVKLLDGVLGEIPLVGLLSGFFLHPRYLITRGAGDAEVLLRVTKRPALWEGKYSVEQVGELRDGESDLALLSVMMFLLMERTRG
jgi:hypothetical protein